MKLTADMMRGLGGRPWAAPDGSHPRVYLSFKVWAALIGLQLQWEWGTIRGGTLGGETLLASWARRLHDTSVYFDVERELLVIDGPDKRSAAEVGDALRAALIAKFTPSKRRRAPAHVAQG